MIDIELRNESEKWMGGNEEVYIEKWKDKLKNKKSIIKNVLKMNHGV